MLSNWIHEIFDNSHLLSFDTNNIIQGVLKQTASKQFHDKMQKGAALRDLTKNKLHQINWETPYYEDVICEFLKENDRNLPVLDLGCGDGRFTKTLLELGYQKIICLDSDYRLLESLHEFSIQEGFRDQLVLIHSDADELHFKHNSIGAVLAIGVLYYLNEKEPLTLKKIKTILSTNGVFLLSEPEIEGMMFRALIFEGLNDAISILENRSFSEGKGDVGFKFSVKSKKEQQDWITSAGFKISDTHGITMFHNYLRIMLVRGLITEDEIETKREALTQLFDFLHQEGSLFKHIIWKCLPQ